MNLVLADCVVAPRRFPKSHVSDYLKLDSHSSARECEHDMDFGWFEPPDLCELK